jgi:indole-3-glycerol phosphate synthase
MKAEAQGSGVLAAILREANRRAASARSGQAGLELRAARAPRPPLFGAALAAGRSVALIAEIKRRSPSAGTLRPAGALATLARRLAEGGAAALSVLTEEAHFGGSLADLAEVARAVPLPVLRKDFILDAAQLYEARAYGAAAVLLIARILPPDRVAELAAVASSLGLATLVEVRGADELRVALAASPTAVGVNARDLDTLAMDAAVVERLIPQVPAGVPAIAESGLASAADIARAAAWGADAVLVGTAISGAADPGAAARTLVGIPRRSRGARRA